MAGAASPRPAIRRTISSPITVWLRITCHSSSLRPPRLPRIWSGITDLPTSCSQPPIRHRITVASRRPSSAAIAADRSATCWQCRRRHALAHRRGRGEGLGEPDRLGLLGHEVLDRQVGVQPHLVAAAALRRVERAVGGVGDGVDVAQHVRGAHRADGHRRRRARRSASRTTACAPARRAAGSASSVSMPGQRARRTPPRPSARRGRRRARSTGAAGGRARSGPRRPRGGRTGR